MNKITCDIIRDLLPLYTDKIASSDTIKLVEEHLAQCRECSAFKNRIETPDLELVTETDNLDYLKKIRKRTDLKSAVCFFLVLITCVFFLEYTKNLYQPKPFFVLVALMLMCNYILFFHNSQKETVGKAKAIIANAVSILLALYTTLIYQISVYHWINNKNAPFNMDYVDLGPLLYNQCLLTMVIEIAIWVRELVLHIKKAHFSIVSSSFGIIGFYMSLYYMRMLKLIDTLDSFRSLCENALILFAEGIGILLLIFIIEKCKRKFL